MDAVACTLLFPVRFHNRPPIIDLPPLRRAADRSLIASPVDSLIILLVDHLYSNTHSNYSFNLLRKSMNLLTGPIEVARVVPNLLRQPKK